ncbi:26S proteasome non-ATPase regulatory subunit 1, partial [Trachymyrmex zeteki]
RQDVYEQLKSNFYQNDIVKSEAAGIATEMVILEFKSTHVIEDAVAVSLMHIFHRILLFLV